MLFSDWMGVIGVSLILIAYFLNTRKILDVRDNKSLILNAAGAMVAGYASYLINYWPFVVLEGIWTLIALFGLWQNLITKKVGL
jgi:hypothetical protein